MQFPVHEDIGTIVRQTNKLKEFDAGVSIAAIGIGIDLPARTGASQEAKLAFRFPESGGRMCGNDANWLKASRIRGIAPDS